MKKHKIIIGENDDNYELTKSIMKNKDSKVLCTLEELIIKTHSMSLSIH